MRLFEGNVPEKLIQERTGHQSSEALRMYERTSLAQQKSVSKLISGVSHDFLPNTGSERASTDKRGIDGISLGIFLLNCTVNVNISCSK